MAVKAQSMFQEDLSQRRQRLVEAIPGSADPIYLRELLAEVDAALTRIDDGSFGLCDVCHDPIEPDRLQADPLIRLCLDHLTPKQQRDLERDLELAAQVQAGLLPPADSRIGAWRVSHCFHPLGLVSGDYCDTVQQPDGGFFFLLGDVSGKGVAASLLMSHLHALFRALIASGHALQELMERASRAFCESTLPNQFATLVCGRATGDGAIEICNAGHPPPVWVRADTIECLDGNGLPLGIFTETRFNTRRFRLSKGDSVILYTDGLLEATNSSGLEYGLERLVRLAKSLHGDPSDQMIAKLTADLAKFRSTAAPNDDTTIMAIQRIE